MAPSGFAREVTDELGGIITYNEQNHAIHKGLTYTVGGHDTLAASPAAGYKYAFLGRVGDKQVHFDGFDAKFEQGGVHIHLFESPTVTDPGTPIAPKRKNRAVNIPATMLTYAQPTVSAEGESIYDTLPPLTGGGANVQPTNGSISEGWLLKENTDYLFVLENTSLIKTVDFDVVFEWHESDIILPVTPAP